MQLCSNAFWALSKFLRHDQKYDKDLQSVERDVNIDIISLNEKIAMGTDQINK